MADDLAPQTITITYLLDLVTSQHNHQPRYMQTVALSVNPYVESQISSNSYWSLFDLDTSVGQQEDMLGEWVGITRYITIDVKSFLTFNEETLGFDKGRWYTSHEVSKQTVRLGDEDYRFLLRARIVANYWDGTIENAYHAWDTLFKPYGLTVLIQDGFARGDRFFEFNDQTGGTHGFDASIWWVDEVLADLYFETDTDDPNNAIDKGIWNSPNSLYYVPPSRVHGSMAIAQVLIGDEPITPVFQSLFSGGYLGLKSAGVGTNYYIQYQTEGPDYSVGWPIFAMDCGPEPYGMWCSFDILGLGHDEAPLFYPTAFPADNTESPEGLDDGWWNPYPMTEPDFYLSLDAPKDRNGLDFGQWLPAGKIGGRGWFPPPYPVDQHVPPTGFPHPPYNLAGFDMGAWAWQLNWHDRII